jgi:hypothetical protein
MSCDAAFDSASSAIVSADNMLKMDLLRRHSALILYRAPSISELRIYGDVFKYHITLLLAMNGRQIKKAMPLTKVNDIASG